MSKKPLINITKNAWTKINSIIKNQNASAFLFLAEGGGCNGFNYKLELINPDAYDKILQKNKQYEVNIIEKNNSKILIDPLSEMFLIGTEIDYIKEDFGKGIFENKFVFTPDKNKMSSCGCGISFSPKF